MPRQRRAKTSAGSSKKPEPAAPPRDPVAQVLEWFLTGRSEQDILQAIAVLYPGKNAPAVVAAVVKHLEEQANAPPDVLIGWCFESTRELYRRMVEIGDFPGALRAVKQILELTRSVRPSTDDGGEARPGGLQPQETA